MAVVHFEKWHGRRAREITRKMRVLPQTEPLPRECAVWLSPM